MGVVVISHGSKSFRLTVDPNSVSWTYNLNTNVDETYGGRVIQILSVRLGDLVVDANSGSGRWEYYDRLARFCRDVLFDQKETGQPARFFYPTKGWDLSVFLAKVPFNDEVGNTHHPFRLRFKIQEDVSGVITQDSMGHELDKIREGIGYERNDYNYPQARDAESWDPENDEEMPTSATSETGEEVSINSPNRGGM